MVICISIDVSCRLVAVKFSEQTDLSFADHYNVPGSVAESNKRSTGDQEGVSLWVCGSGPATFFRWDWPWNFFYDHSLPSPDSRREGVIYLQKYVHRVLVNHLIGLGLPRKSVVRLTDRSNMTLAVDCGLKATTQQQHYNVSEDRSFLFMIQFIRMQECTCQQCQPQGIKAAFTLI